MGRAAATRAALRDAALELFRERGYDATTTAAIAQRAGVSEMTLFRHYATKDALLMDDPYDPLIATCVTERPPDEPPFVATVHGIGDAWGQIQTAEAATMRERLRLVADAPGLHGAMARNTRRTEEAVRDALRARGVAPIEAAMVAAAVLGALNAGLLAWASGDDEDPSIVFTTLHRMIGGD